MTEPLVWLPFEPAELGRVPEGLRYEVVLPEQGVPLPASAAEVAYYVQPYRFSVPDNEVIAELPQLKVVQTAEVKEAALKTLSDFMEEQKDILLELSSRAGGVADVQDLFIDRSEVERQGMLQDALDTLTRYAA